MNQLSRISKFTEELGNYSIRHVAKLKLRLKKIPTSPRSTKETNSKTLVHKA